MRCTYGDLGADFTSARLWRWRFLRSDEDQELRYVEKKPEDLELPAHMRMSAARHSPFYVKPRGSGLGGGGSVIG